MTGSISQSPSHAVDSKPLPRWRTPVRPGGGHGMGSYQPGGAEVTGSLPAAPPPPSWTWEGGTPITLSAGESLETISHRYGVPVAAILEANNISNRGLCIRASIW